MTRPARSRSPSARPKPLAPAPMVPSATRRRIIGGVVVAGLLGWAIIDHVTAFRRGGDDWGRFDHQSVAVVAVLAGDLLQVRPGRGPSATVHLIGLNAPPPGGGADDACRFLAGRLPVGCNVTLLLDGPATRDAAGRVRAYAYADGACLNVEVVKAGWARVERRQPCPFDGLLRPAEADARKHGRGVWAGEAVPRPTAKL